MYRRMEDERFRRFSDLSENVAEFIRRRVSEGFCFTILCHLDADGLSSGAIMGRALMRLEAPFQIRVLKQLDEESIRAVYKGDRVTVIVDMGSGSLDILSKLENSDRITVLDHHQPQEEYVDKFKGLHLNPHLCGLNGANDVSGSGVSYLVARSMDSSNVDLSPLAVVGAVGDMQDRNEKRGLTGFNRIIVEEASKAGFLRVEKGLLILGRETKPLHKALASTMEPFIPGISGEEDQALAFLTSINIPVKDGDLWRTLTDLSEEEKARMLDNLVAYMTSKGVAQADTQKLVGEIYIAVREQKFTPLRDCREYAALLNSCGRLGKCGLGIAVAMGDRRRSILDEAYSTLNEYRRRLAALIKKVVQNPLRFIDMGEITLVNGIGLIPENLLSTVASILSASYTVKPLIAFTEAGEGAIKVSARAPKRTVNIANVMSKAAESVGGFGGGHDVAAGAIIPVDKRNEFVRKVMVSLGEHRIGQG